MCISWRGAGACRRSEARRYRGTPYGFLRCLLPRSAGLAGREAAPEKTLHLLHEPFIAQRAAWQASPYHQDTPATTRVNRNLYDVPRCVSDFGFRGCELPEASPKLVGPSPAATPEIRYLSLGFLNAPLRT